MKKLLLPLLFVVVAISSFGAPCVQTTLANYASGYIGATPITPCEIDGITFSNFNANGYWSITGVGAQAFTNSDLANVLVTPAGPGTLYSYTNLNPGFVINPGTLLNCPGALCPSNAFAGDLNIQYTVSGANFLGAQANYNPGGGGGSSLNETFITNPGTGSQGTAAMNLLSSGNSAGTVMFSGPVNSYIVNKDLAFTIGPSNGNNGSGLHISNIENTSIVPEPMTMSLLGVGLLGLGFFGRRFRK